MIPFRSSRIILKTGIPSDCFPSSPLEKTTTLWSSHNFCNEISFVSIQFFEIRFWYIVFLLNQLIELFVLVYTLILVCVLVFTRIIMIFMVFLFYVFVWLHRFIKSNSIVFSINRFQRIVIKQYSFLSITTLFHFFFVIFLFFNKRTPIIRQMT